MTFEIKIMNEYKLQIAELLVRIFAGVLFLLQGYDKLFSIQIDGVIKVFIPDAKSHHVPNPLIKIMAWYTSLVEFFGGILLLLGLFTNYALYALGLDLLLVCIAFSYLEPMWDMKNVFPRFILIITLLLIPAEYNYFGLDRLLNLK
jgi:uncharacterized membrane protein YphA (DoxX/SURF4 family)